MDGGILDDDGGPLALHGRRPRTADTRMLADIVRTLVRQLPDVAVESAAPAATILRRLILLAPRGPQEVVDARLQADRGALADIKQQPAGRLDVAAMIDDLSLMRTTLYRLFKADGCVCARSTAACASGWGRTEFTSGLRG